MSTVIVLPIAILISGAFLIYVLSRVFNLTNRMESLVTVLFLLGSLVSLIVLNQDLESYLLNNDAFFGLDAAGGIVYKPYAFSGFILIISVFIGLLITIFSGENLSNDPRYLVFYPLVLLTLSGLFGIFLSNNLFNLFLLTELTTVAASALIAFRFHQEIAIKAGFKYLIMSSIGTMMMLLGIYFVYRSTGDMHLYEMLSAPDDFTRVGGACFLLGFSLKAGVVPLHTWVPDVYGHAPSPVSGLLAGVLSKSMLFIMPIICLRLGLTKRELGFYLMVFGCLNMLVGSIRLLRQPLLRRFLSFSSIGQTGYLMFGLGMGYYYNLPQAFSAGLFLFVIVAVMKCSAFLNAGILEHYFGTQDINKLKGISSYAPLPSLYFSISLAGLAGIPLLAGFIGKWMVFSAALTAGDIFSTISLIFFVLSSVIGLGGYLPMIVKIYQQSDGTEKKFDGFEKPLVISKWMSIPVAILTLLVIVMGVFPTPWLRWVSQIIAWMAL